MAIFIKQAEAKQKDLNRFRKVYRYVRKKPVLHDGNADVISQFPWGSYPVYFDNQTAVTHYFSCCYDTATSGNPVVVATATGASSNFNVFVSAISGTQATIETSTPYTGIVDIQVIQPGVYSMPNIGKSLEVIEEVFTNTNTKTISFTAGTFTCVPVVTATAEANVNVYVSAVTTSQVTVEVSQANYSGKVYIQAIERGC